jgi:hypothetical protein
MMSHAKPPSRPPSISVIASHLPQQQNGSVGLVCRRVVNQQGVLGGCTFPWPYRKHGTEQGVGSDQVGFGPWIGRGSRMWGRSKLPPVSVRTSLTIKAKTRERSQKHKSIQSSQLVRVCATDSMRPFETIVPHVYAHDNMYTTHILPLVITVCRHRHSDYKSA